MSDAKDVLISFTHIDDEPLFEGQSGWVTEFHRHVETRLNKLWGRQSAVWRDPSLQGNDLLLPAIERQLLRVKALVSVISPRYVRSSWCQKEMLGFLKASQANGGFQVGDQVRWFKVLKSPLAKQDLPPDFPGELTGYFENLLGYAFFDIDPQSKRPREYSREFGQQAEQLYHAKVYDLAWDLCNLLKKLEVEKAGAASPPGTQKTVYLAASTADVQSDRDRIRRELLDRGHVVLGDASLPLVAGDLQEAVRAALRASDVSIHLMGSLYGFVPEGSTESILGIQNSLAAELARTGPLRRIIRIPSDPAISDPRHAAFLRSLREDEQAQAGAEVLEGSLDQAVEVLLSMLDPKPKSPTQAPPGATAHDRANPLIYLIGDPADTAAMDVVEDFLFEKGMEVTRSSFEGSAEELAAAHRRRLVECDAALIYYGASSRDWVDMKLMDLDQAFGYGREKEYRAKAICLAPPDDRKKQRFRTRAAEVVQFDGQHPETFGVLVERLHDHN